MMTTLPETFYSGIGKFIVPVLGFLLALQAYITFFWKDPNPVFFLLVLTSLVVLGTGLLGDGSGQLDFRQPWSLLLVFHLPFWVLGSWSFALDETQWTTLLIGADSQINRALLMLSLGFTFIAIGYRFGVQFKPRPRGAKLRDWDLSKMLILGVIGYLVCWYLRIEWYRNVLVRPYFDLLGSEPVSTLVRTASTTLPSFLVVCAWTIAYQLRTNRKLYALCLLLTLCEVFWGLLYGVMKSLIFLPVFLPVLPYMVMRNKIPWIRIALVGTLLIGVAYPYVDAVREYYFQENGPSRPEAMKKAFEDGFDALSPQRETVTVYSQRALNRVSGLSSLCQALQLDAEGSLDINGAFYRRAILGLVPRFLWKNKPIIHEGTYFSAYVDGQRGLNNVDLSLVTSSVAPTLFGSFFWNFGWWGVVFTSLALGIFSGVVYRAVAAHQLSHPSTVLYYIAILNCLETTETEVAKMPASLVWGIAMVWLANRVLQKRADGGRVQKHRRRPSSTPGQATPAAVPDGQSGGTGS